MIDTMVVITDETRPIRSELRPPYTSRVPTSRPSWSAPKKYAPPDAPHCGPIGMPPGVRWTWPSFPKLLWDFERIGILWPFSWM